MTLLADLISIPAQVHASDFVVSLKDGWAEPDRVLSEYVVTEQLEGCFGEALDLVTQAVGNHRSMGAYLHGSFGSGKSHFMAVLHQLLTDGSPARTSAQFGNIVGRHGDALAGKKFLLVPVHFIGGDSMGQQILGGYVNYVRRLHPDAPTPAVYVDDDLVANAVDLRGRFGDEAFFGQLSGGVDEAWGEYASGWDAERFDAAVVDGHDGAERRDLVSALLDTVLSSYASAVESSGVGFVPLEQGLAVVSRHAAALGYAGVVLFLDEMILWFASRMADQAFVNREASLVAKLVECEHAERPAPIVSFIARQRDLRELVGDLPGAEKANFSDILKFWEGRFSTITLEDRNLIAITEKRVLRPVSEDARQALVASFDDVQRKVETRRHLEVLLGGAATLDQFRRVYPFNPALIEALVALSSALQRDRTALKVMLQLLSEHRHDLELGDLVPFGDLYDVIAREADPFTDTMKAQFINARKLWDQRLAPMLASDHGLVGDDAATKLPPAHGYWAEARLLKTLLLAALVPETPSLRAMTVSRLVALNSGTIRVPFPGTEQAQVLGKLRSWASQVGEIRLGDDPVDPTVMVHLTGIDLEPLLDAVGTHDNPGQRVRLARELVEQRLAVPVGVLQPTIEMVWRGSRRAIDVVIGNVYNREQLPDTMFRADGNVRLIVDLPLDPTPGIGPRDDYDRLDGNGADLGDPDTVVWLPNFLSTAGRNALGRLVRIDYLLKGDNLDTNASRLMSVDDRALARQQLAAQRDALLLRLNAALDICYGLVVAESADVEAVLGLDQQFVRLGDGTVRATPPTGHTLRVAAERLGGQMLAGRYPAHPDFGDRVLTGTELRVAREWMDRLAGADHRRIDGVPSTDRGALRKVLNPLRLGQMYENHVVASQSWIDHFQQLIATEAPSPLTVGHLRRWIDVPVRHGLDAPVADLVVLSFCAMTNRVLRAYGDAITGELGKLQDGWQVEESELPTEDVWQKAVSRAAHLGRTPLTARLSATTAEKLARELAGDYLPHARAAADLDRALAIRMRALGIDPASADRSRTAAFTARLLGRFGTDTLSTLNALGDVDAPTSWGAVGKSAKDAEVMLAELEQTNWELIGGAIALGTPGAVGLRDQLRAVLVNDQVGENLVVGLRRVVADATKLMLARSTAPSPPADPTGSPGSTDREATGPTAGSAASLVHSSGDRQTHIVATLAEAPASAPIDGDGLSPGVGVLPPPSGQAASSEVPMRMTRDRALGELERIRERLRSEARTDLTWEFRDLDGEGGSA